MYINIYICFYLLIDDRLRSCLSGAIKVSGSAIGTDITRSEGYDLLWCHGDGALGILPRVHHHVGAVAHPSGVLTLN